MTTAHLLVEIGTEELPPKALRGLAASFAEAVGQQLADERLAYGEVRAFASPRRLAVLVSEVSDRQEDRSVELKGPPVTIAFGDDGEPRPAAEAFAKKAGVPLAALERRSTARGEWLYACQTVPGEAIETLAPRMISSALARLPIPRPMRWGDGEEEFVRPVHWVVLMHGSRTLDGWILGVRTGNTTRGHRFHAPGALTLADAADFERLLESSGFVLPDLDARRSKIRRMVEAAAAEAGGRPVGDDELYDEVAALVEWPVAVVGEFEKQYLELPREVVVATLTGHQRYFPIADADGGLLPAFVTIANIDSRDPDRVRDGNERVIRPRLADAAFFWEVDKRVPLADRVARLDEVVYQQGLGTIGDKSRRLADLCRHIAGLLGDDEDAALRAGLLSKGDLLTGMVGEFPELQGTMGAYYAADSNETSVVATAIGEQYQPAFAGDGIPDSAVGRYLALADRLDTLCGVFALGKKPSGNKDPFGLRRAALGVVRILIEADMDIDLVALVEVVSAAQPVNGAQQTADDVYEFIVDRLKAYAADEMDITTEMFEAVRERRPRSILDFAARLRAVRAFVRLDAASALAAANKRIGNILRQADFEAGPVEPALFAEAAERSLFEQLDDARVQVTPLLGTKSYSAALTRLADLQNPVNRFFDDVMVMADDEQLRDNRLRLLAALRELFLDIADISRLAIR